MWATFRVHIPQASSSQLKLLPQIATASFPSLLELTGVILNGAKSLSLSSLKDLLNSKPDIIKSILDHFLHVPLLNPSLHLFQLSLKTQPALLLSLSSMDSKSAHWQLTHLILLLSKFKLLLPQFLSKASVSWSPLLLPLKYTLYLFLILSMIPISKI